MNLYGVEMAVTHFVKKFTHVSRQFIVKNKKNCFKKTVLKVWSQICEKSHMCPQNYIKN